MMLAMLVGLCSFAVCTITVILIVMGDIEADDITGRSAKELCEEPNVPGSKQTAFLFQRGNMRGDGYGKQRNRWDSVRSGLLLLVCLG